MSEILEKNTLLELEALEVCILLNKRLGFCYKFSVRLKIYT